MNGSVATPLGPIDCGMLNFSKEQFELVGKCAAVIGRPVRTGPSDIKAMRHLTAARFVTVVDHITEPGGDWPIVKVTLQNVRTMLNEVKRQHQEGRNL
jgi:hypothetical protein